MGLLLFALLLGNVPATIAAETPDWFYHDIVDVDFVMQQIQIPMSDNVMIIDARPAKPKYVKGHIPMASAPASKVKAGTEEGSIDIEYFKATLFKAPDAFHLIDVRGADEFATGSLKSATNLPVDNLEAKIATLPQDKPIVFICGTGARSGESFYMVQDLRPEMKNVYYLDAEMTINKDGSFVISKPVS